MKCFEAFIRQNALLGVFVPKMESEIASRASSLKPAEVACVARAFALNIATPTTVISPLPDKLVSFVNVQVEPLGLAEWAAFQDALRTRHCEPLLSRAHAPNEARGHRFVPDLKYRYLAEAAVWSLSHEGSRTDFRGLSLRASCRFCLCGWDHDGQCG